MSYNAICYSIRTVSFMKYLRKTLPTYKRCMTKFNFLKTVFEKLSFFFLFLSDNTKNEDFLNSENYCLSGKIQHIY